VAGLAVVVAGLTPAPGAAPVTVAVSTGSVGTGVT
jgi:hypothetical protein